MTDDAVRDGQGFASVELYSRRADTSALDGQAAQADGIVHASSDHYAIAARGNDDSRFKATWVHDADCLNSLLGVV